MLVVEGPDGAGKTTLVKELCTEFGLQVGKRGAKNRDELWKSTREDTYRALAQAVEGVDPTYVWDRLFWSEFAYHEIVGRECEFKSLDLGVVNGVIYALGAPVIFCMPPLTVVKENVDKEHQMKGVKGNVVQTYNNYQWLLANNVYVPRKLGILIYDYTSDSAKAQREAISIRVQAYLDFKRKRMP